MDVHKICDILCKQSKGKDKEVQETLVKVVADLFVIKSDNDDNDKVNTKSD